MKKISLLLILLASIAGFKAHAQTRTAVDLLGVWTGNQLRVEFRDYSRVTVVFTGNKEQTGVYTSDFLLEPATLDMSFKDGDKTLAFKCLVQFIDNNTLKWESFNQADHPRYFTNACSLLRRVKN